MYRRQKARILQNSLSMPVGVFLFCYWTFVVVTVGIPFWRKIDWDAYFDAIRVTVPEYDIPVLNNYLSWFLTPPRWRNPYMLALLTVLGRMVMFLLFGVIRLAAIANRLRHERISRSFDFVTISELASEVPTPLFAEPLYQYKPLWLILIPLFISGYFIAAPLPQILKENLPPEMAIIIRNNTLMMGIVLLLETGLRVGLEIAWRYLRLDIEGVQPLSRWILRRLAKTKIRLPSLKLTSFRFRIGRIGLWQSLPSFLRLPRARGNETDDESDILLT